MKRRIALAGALLAMTQGVVPAQQEGDDEPPTLDELLGLDEEEKASIPETTEEELERKLTGEEAADSFREAARLMGEAAGRLNRAGDVGIDTQRLQEEIIRRLEMIIDSAPRQQQSSSSQSSSQQRPQNDQQQQQQQQRDAQNQAGQGENRQENMPPGLQEGQLGPAPALGSALWGALPERIRDAISQGTSDEFSALYQGLTEAYYRRLAEEANK
jgi:hypothetical protein